MISFKTFLTESYTIGKKMGHDHYVHKDYEHVLPKDDLEKAKKHLPSDHKYTVVKHNKKDGHINNMFPKDVNVFAKNLYRLETTLLKSGISLKGYKKSGVRKIEIKAEKGKVDNAI